MKRQPIRRVSWRLTLTRAAAAVRRVANALFFGSATGEKRVRYSVIVGLAGRSQIASSGHRLGVALSWSPDIEVIFVAAFDERFPPALRGGRGKLVLGSPDALPALLNAGARASKGSHLLFLTEESAVQTRSELDESLRTFDSSNGGSIAALSVNPISDLAGVLRDGQGTPLWLLISAATFNAVGGFSTDYEEQFFDADLCMQLHRRGFVMLTRALPELAGARDFGPREINLGDRAVLVDRWNIPGSSRQA